MLFRSLLVLAVVGAQAFAQDDQPVTSVEAATGSEYLHQAPGGAFELSPGLMITTERLKGRGTVRNRTASQLMLMVEGEYGFNDMFSLGANLGVGVGATSIDNCPSNTTCNDTRQSGMRDAMVTFNGRVPFGLSAFRFGLDLSQSFGEAVIEKDGDSNLASGGTTLTPFVGFETTFGASLIGAKLGYDVYQSDRDYKNESPPATKFKVKDGQRLNAALFYEYTFPKIVSVGAALEYLDRADSKTSGNGTTSKNKDGASLTMLNVYVPLRFNPRVTLIPEISSGLSKYKTSNSSFKEHVVSQVAVNARFTF